MEKYIKERCPYKIDIKFVYNIYVRNTQASWHEVLLFLENWYAFLAYNSLVAIAYFVTAYKEACICSSGRQVFHTHGKGACIWYSECDFLLELEFAHSGRDMMSYSSNIMTLIHRLVHS